MSPDLANFHRGNSMKFQSASPRGKSEASNMTNLYGGKSSVSKREVRETDDIHSCNSSDIEAYKDSDPIPVLKQAFMEYLRNKKKANMRRG